MQFSENWLRQYINPDLSSEALEQALTMAGLEVEARTPVAKPFHGVVIGEIIEAVKHPDADRLQLCKVNVGLAQPLQIVCGAPNARVGIKVPCAMVGAELPSVSIKQAKVRGVESFGMLCSAKELGLTEDAAGLLELPAQATVGEDIREFLNLNDHLFTLKLTPNRADCLSILGIARDVAAITGAELTLPNVQEMAIESSATRRVKVSAAEACPSYCGRVVTGVNAQAQTPDWVLQALERSGLRGINAIVDVTNYVLLAFGQPMHAFDLNKLDGDIEVRLAKTDESLILLNDAEIKLVTDDLVIADGSGAVALAGIMGGKSTAVDNNTSSVFLESAFFAPDLIAGKARRIGLSTDSSYRFERGVDFANARLTLDYATQLIVKICGGQAGEITECVNHLPVRNKIILRYDRLLSVLGIDITKQTVLILLNQLGFGAEQTENGFTVQAPSYRFDIAREEDLIEEVARLHGYDQIPAIAPVASLNMLPAPEAKLSPSDLADLMQRQGYQEVVTYSFVDANWELNLAGNLKPIVLKNPIASNMSVMRSTLFGGLLEALTFNTNRKQVRAMLFEMGSAFHQFNDGFCETMQIAGLCYGSALPEQWASESRQFDYFDVKSMVETLTQGQAEYRKEVHPALHPGQTARVYLHGNAIGWLGKLHPKWQQHYNLQNNTIMFELEVKPLTDTKIPVYQEISKFLAVRRDISVVVDSDINVQSIIDVVNEAQIPLLQELQLFDIYQGKGIPENKKSLAFLILMQDTHKTLVDSEADAAMANLLKLLENKFNAQLRN